MCGENCGQELASPRSSIGVLFNLSLRVTKRHKRYTTVPFGALTASLPFFNFAFESKLTCRHLALIARTTCSPLLIHPRLKFSRAQWSCRSALLLLSTRTSLSAHLTRVCFLLSLQPYALVILRHSPYKQITSTYCRKTIMKHLNTFLFRINNLLNRIYA